MRLNELGHCLRLSGKPCEAEGYVQRALQIAEAHLGQDNMQVTRDPVNSVFAYSGRVSSKTYLGQ